jgi:protein NrfD
MNASEKTQASFSPAGEWERLGPYHGETYYGQPAVKSSYYGWYIAFYFFVGGLASASQFLATVISFLGHREDSSVVRAGRYAALLGALVSPPLLIADLHTPQRWYNMLRIYRRTSPMSIGSWALTSFGIFSGLTAVGQAITDLLGWKAGERLSKLASLPAALAGGVVAIYTGTLLVATSTPLWSSASPFLSSLFASSAASSAAAVLTLSASTQPGSRATRRRLTWFSIISGAAELVFMAIIGRNFWRQQVAAPLNRGALRPAWYAGVVGLGVIGPLILHTIELITGRESRRRSSAASAATLLGSLFLRAVMIFAGNASSRRPEDYFQLTQPAARSRERRVRA